MYFFRTKCVTTWLESIGTYYPASKKVGSPYCQFHAGFFTSIASDALLRATLKRCGLIEGSSSDGKKHDVFDDYQERGRTTPGQGSSKNGAVHSDSGDDISSSLSSGDYNPRAGKPEVASPAVDYTVRLSETEFHWIRKINEWVFTGHSLGGSRSQICMMLLQKGWFELTDGLEDPTSPEDVAQAVWEKSSSSSAEAAAGGVLPVGEEGGVDVVVGPGENKKSTSNGKVADSTGRKSKRSFAAPGETISPERTGAERGNGATIASPNGKSKARPVALSNVLGNGGSSRQPPPPYRHAIDNEVNTVSTKIMYAVVFACPPIIYDKTEAEAKRDAEAEAEREKEREKAKAIKESAADGGKTSGTGIQNGGRFRTGRSPDKGRGGDSGRGDVETTSPAMLVHDKNEEDKVMMSSPEGEDGTSRGYGIGIAKERVIITPDVTSKARPRARRRANTYLKHNIKAFVYGNDPVPRLDRNDDSMFLKFMYGVRQTFQNIAAR